MKSRFLRWRVQIGFIVAIAALVVAFWNLHPSRVWSVVREAGYLWFAPAALCYLGSMASRNWRWSYLLKQVHPVRARDVLPITLIGYLVNNIVPARAGELVRAHLVHRRFGIRWMTGIATIVLERVLDGVSMVALLLLAPVLLRSAVGVPQSLVLWGTLTFGTALLIMAGLQALPQRVRQSPGRASNSWWFIGQTRLSNLLVQFAAGLACLRSAKHLLTTIAITTLIWIFEASTYWIVAQGFRLGDALVPLMLTMAVASLATAIPSAPGYLGTFEVAGISTLRAFGVPAETAAGYVLSLHALIWLEVSLLGAWQIRRLGVQWQPRRILATVEEQG